MNRPWWIVLVTVVALAGVGVVGYGRFRPTHDVAPVAQIRAPSSRVVTLEVGGITCGACITKVSDELKRVPGVAIVDPLPTQKRFTVVCADTVADATLTAAVRRAGPEYLGMVVPR